MTTSYTPQMIAALEQFVSDAKALEKTMPDIVAAKVIHARAPELFEKIDAIHDRLFIRQTKEAATQ